MSIQITIGPSLFKKLERVIEITDEKVIGIGKDVVNAAVDLSPVDTGAYIESHSVVPRGSGGGRSRSSRNRPRGRSWAEFQGPVRSDLLSSVAAIKPSETGGFTLVNRSPHARYVEYGNQHYAGYRVYEQLRGMF